MSRHLAAAAFRVTGTPGPKGSHATVRRRDGGRGVRQASARGRAWEATVAQEAMVARVEQCGSRTLPPPYALELNFFFHRPARPSHAWPSTTDVDKLVRSTTDGLVRGGLLADDRHVIELRASSNFTTGGDSFALVTVRSCDVGEP